MEGVNSGTAMVRQQIAVTQNKKVNQPENEHDIPFKVNGMWGIAWTFLLCMGYTDKSTALLLSEMHERNELFYGGSVTILKNPNAQLRM